MLGLLIFIPTVAFVPHLLYILPFLYLLFEKMLGKRIFFPLNANVKLILIIMVLVLLNRFFFINDHIFVEEKESVLHLLVPNILFLIVMYYIAINLKRRDLNILLYLIVFEAIVTIIEFYYGKTTFFTNLNRFKEVDIADNNFLLYLFRPMGLSENSSILAVKLFIGLIILYYNSYLIRNLLKIFFYIVLITALIFSFNRTALVSILVFYSLVFIKFYFSPNKKLKYLIFKNSIVFVFISIVGVVIYKFGSLIWEQFTRGGDTDILTGRGTIWHSFMVFIENHFLFGNGSYRLYLPFFHGGWTYAHAHNSYLEIIATHGIIIASLYIFLILININKYNYIYLIPFLVFSLAQYMLFWGISIQDIIFFYFLFNKEVRNANFGKKNTRFRAKI